MPSSSLALLALLCAFSVATSFTIDDRDAADVEMPSIEMPNMEMLSMDMRAPPRCMLSPCSSDADCCTGAPKCGPSQWASGNVCDNGPPTLKKRAPPACMLSPCSSDADCCSGAPKCGPSQWASGNVCDNA